MERLDKILAHLNYGSRKEVKTIIRKGYVRVNGEVVLNDDTKADPINDEITIFDDSVKYSDLVYIMLNKPSGYISATYDPKLPTVLDLVPEYSKMKVFPVGRLDIDTEGLLILTNDGKLAYNLLAPKKHVNKKYYVEFSGEFKEEYHKRLEEGLDLGDFVTKSATCEIIDKGKCYINISEGKFHQVKRMFEALDMHVTYLRRVEFKNLKLDPSLNLGDYRELSQEEIEDLKNEER